MVFISLLLSVFMPLAYAFFLADVNTDVDAVNGVMSSLFQLSAYLLLMPLLVILASNLLFEELDNDTLKNLVTIPINRTKLVLSKMLVLLLFGGTSIKREAGKDLSIDCALEVTDGTAKVFWISEADEEVTLLETTGTYSDTITLPEGGNYIGIECENFTGSIELNME